MVIHKVLDEVFSTWSNVAVLRVLNHHVLGLSGREVSRLAGMSPKNCIITLTGLENLGIVNRIRGGRDHLFTLNREHFMVNEAIAPLFDTEEKFREAIYADIKKGLSKLCNSVYVFGSVARREENIDSDLDLCVIYDSEHKKEPLENAVYDLSLKVRRMYSVNISAYYVTAKQFSIKAKTNKAPIADVVKEGKLLFGNSIKVLLNAKRN